MNRCLNDILHKTTIPIIGYNEGIGFKTKTCRKMKCWVLPEVKNMTPPTVRAYALFIDNELGFEGEEHLRVRNLPCEAFKPLN